jgi:ABC-type lipoprotein release transport system permease subunit
MLLSTATLAVWRLRRMWGMLFITELGMIAAVLLLCAAPLYSHVALTAGLRDVLTAERDSATLSASLHLNSASSYSVSDGTYDVNQSIQNAGLHNYMSGSSQFVVESEKLNFINPTPPNVSDTLQLEGYDVKEVVRHTKMVQGRLPDPRSSVLEITLMPEVASALRVAVGSTVVVQTTIFTMQNHTPVQQKYPLPLHVVGIFAADLTNDVFWHGNNVNFSLVKPGRPPELSVRALVSSDAFFTQLSKLDSMYVGSADVANLAWYYQLNTSHLSIDQLDALITSLGTWQDILASGQFALNDIPYYGLLVPQGDVLSHSTTQGTLERYRARVGVLQIPNGLVLFQILALILFFVGLMAGLLVERQTETIAILRSRGANCLQIFGSFLTQSVSLGIVALLVGPLLALFAVSLMTQHILSAQDSTALNVITSDPASSLYGVRNYALAAVLLTVAAMGFSMYRAAGMDVLAIRRESSRSTSKPLWQKLNLDIFAIVIAITGYFVSQYVSGLQELDLQASDLIASPLALIAPLFLIIASVLLVLRLFPLLLQFISSFATRGRGASVILALGQMARAPRQAMRITLLLALASAFAIFALVFTSSQEQRVYDLAAYRIGSDFSGATAYDSPQSIQEQTTDFVQHTHGVLAATFGYTGSARIDSLTDKSSFEVRGVDANTFAQTATWVQTNSTQSLASLMRMLIARRGDVAKSHFLPALVDATLWQQLRLSAGAHFSLHMDDFNGKQIDTITVIALAEIQHTPTIQGRGLLFDYQSGGTIYHSVFGASLARNYVWVKTSDNPAAIASVRDALATSSLRIFQLGDRRELMRTLSTDPLYLDLIGILALGAITALLLALVGSLLASWLSARNRITHFAVLRALGTSAKQVAGVLTWEQGITYILAIILGIVFGVLLSVTAIPSLVFSSVPTTGLTSESSSDQFYALQHIIPIQITVPASLVVAFVLLMCICSITLWMMVRVVTQPALQQMLRLNED